MRRRRGRGAAGEGPRAVQQQLGERDGGGGRGRGAAGRGRMGFEVGGLRVGGDLYVGRVGLAGLGGGAGLVAGLDLGIHS